MKTLSFLARVTLFAVVFVVPLSGQPATDCTFPLPSATEVGEPAFRKSLYAFIEGRCYSAWVHDPKIRDTGPFLDNKNFGTHPAVKVYYSPKAWQWMKSDRTAAIPDGEIIVKEMFPPPAGSSAKLEGWTVMVKDAKASFDGWYWSYHAPGEAPNNPIDYPESGFGLYCVRCHASVTRELTFADVENVEGKPLTFTVQVPTMAPEPAKRADLHRRVADAGDERPAPKPPAASPQFTKRFAVEHLLDGEHPPDFNLPPESFDHVVPKPGAPDPFITSDQCLGCHSASSVNMAYAFADAKKAPVNLSPYTEWRASMMGLAGRDPVFYSQLETEKKLWPSRTEFIDHTCFTCHGVMGRRQIELDGRGPFRQQMVSALPGEPNAKYGALARDGVSCAVCHHIAPETLGTPESFTGNFRVGPAAEMYGPYKEVATIPMRNALGVTPVHAEQISSSALCGSCHTVILPVLDAKGNEIKKIVEQATYFEWQNSIYQNERAPIDPAQARSCSDCHMPRSYRNRSLVFRVANVEDSSYPEAPFLAPDADITPVPRDRYSRHMLMGINVFTLEMFRQFPSVLGVRTIDYMYSDGVPGLTTAHESALELARNETARVTIENVRASRDSLETRVRIENLAGHGLPSGVEFRRVFVHFEVLDDAGKVLWTSGATSPLGEILNGRTDEALPTERMKNPKDGKPLFQPHYEVITREDQVQIYEELVIDPEGDITTSFFALDKHVKENRLLPKGWRADGPAAEHTAPFGNAASDPDYQNGSGSDTILYRVPRASVPGASRVRATLNYQALPPYYLDQRFANGHGTGTRRLAYLASRLDLKGTPMQDWKLELTRAEAKIEP
jgi:hypothetical protein